ncbi:MAG: hypothetical protein PVS3B1_32840 [Ktedonobacteraceae bacterium]
MANSSVSLVLLALDRQRRDVFHMTLLSHETYEAALQEVIGMGRVILKNEREVVRVEIHKDEVTEAAPLVVLTRDDISFQERGRSKPRIGLISTIADWFRR